MNFHLPADVHCSDILIKLSGKKYANLIFQNKLSRTDKAAQILGPGGCWGDSAVSSWLCLQEKVKIICQGILSSVPWVD